MQISRRLPTLLTVLLLLTAAIACGGQADDDGEPDVSTDTGPAPDAMMCGADKKMCSGDCIDTQSNTAHCGGCGKACPPGGFWCKSGQCKCLGDATKCGDTCINLQENDQNCGKCGNACGGGKACKEGVCKKLTAVEALIEATNEARSKTQTCPDGSGTHPPAPPVTGNAELHEAAQKHADRMASRGFFDHQDPYDMSTPGSRVRATDYSGRYSGENIAAGNRSAKRTVKQWLTSKTGHCKNLMNPDHDEMGVGYTRGTGSSPYPHYWVQVFGRE